MQLIKSAMKNHAFQKRIIHRLTASPRSQPLPPFLKTQFSNSILAVVETMKVKNTGMAQKSCELDVVSISSHPQTLFYRVVGRLQNPKHPAGTEDRPRGKEILIILST